MVENDKFRPFWPKCGILVIILLSVTVLALLVATVLFAVERFSHKTGSNGTKSYISFPTTADWFTITATVREFERIPTTSTPLPTTVSSSTTSTVTPVPTGVEERCFRVGTTPGFYKAANNILESIDFSADPCEDFYEFACGVWPLKHPRPADKSSYSTYTRVRDTVSQNIVSAIGKIDVNSSKTEQLLKDVYTKCVDTVTLDKLAGKPLLALFQQINGPGSWPIIDPSWRDEEFSIEKLAGILKRDYGVDTLVSTYVNAYEFNNTETILQISGAFLPLGLGAFTGKYYLNDTLYGSVMEAYFELIISTAYLLQNESDRSFLNASDAVEILNFERKLANLSQKAFETEFQTQKWTVIDLKQEINSFNWDKYFHYLLPLDLKTALYGPQFQVELSTPVFLKQMLNLVRATPERVLQNYALWRLVKYSLPYLGIKYRRALEKFEAVYHGNEQPISIEHSCMELIRGRYDLPGLAYATGHVFVKQNFSLTAKLDVQEMVKSIKNGFETMLDENLWMDNVTKNKAIRKARAMNAHVGFPDWILNQTLLEQYYEGLNIISNDSMLSVYNTLRSWSVKKNQLSLLYPFDKSAFGGSPAATDAWYSAARNSISIPAGELQNPFYDYNFPKSVNFGAIGAVIGHEMSHGFDLSGSTFDSVGNLNSWWTQKSLHEFLNRTRCLKDDFSAFCHEGIGCVNGAATTSENIADLAGLTAALRAYNRHIELNGEEARLPRLESFSNEQIFFLSFASFWCGSSTHEYLRNQLLTDKHTPDRFRVIGTLRNLDAFAKTFQCRKGSYMNPRRKCYLW